MCIASDAWLGPMVGIKPLSLVRDEVDHIPYDIFTPATLKSEHVFTLQLRTVGKKTLYPIEIGCKIVAAARIKANWPQSVFDKRLQLVLGHLMAMVNVYIRCDGHAPHRPSLLMALLSRSSVWAIM